MGKKKPIMALGLDKMTIRNTLLAIFLTLGVLLALLIVAVTCLVFVQHELADIEHRRYESYKLGDELRQSSDDLTRMARTYVTTLDPVYKTYFYDILAIRDGEKPRPAYYNGIYWDFVAASGETPTADGPKISLHQMMLKLDLSEVEINKLNKAQQKSNALVALETKAMNAVTGQFDDGLGKPIRHGEPDPDLARSIMYGKVYHLAKMGIMKPINEFFQLLEARMLRQVQTGRHKERFYTGSALVLLISTVLLSAISFMLLKRRVIKPVRQLVRHTRHLRNGEYDQLLNFESKDEFNELAQAFNQMGTSIGHDISTRKKVERELRESEQHFRSLVENIPGVTFRTTWGEGSKVLYVGGASGSITGYPVENFLNESPAKFTDLVHPTDAERVIDGVKQAIKSGKTYTDEFRLIRTDGEVCWILNKTVPVYDEFGALRFLDGVLFDINDRRIAEEELARNQWLLRSVMDNSNAVIYIKDPDGRYLMVNRQWSEVVGSARDAALGKTDYELFPSDVAEQFVLNDACVRQSKKLYTAEEFLDVNGERRAFVSSKFPLLDNSGNLFATAGVSTDISQLKKAEEQLRDARERADNANRAKSEFLANMSHEIRTPMNGIMGMTELALNTELTDEQHEYLTTIQTSSEVLLSLINDILDFSKIEAHKLALESINFDLRELIGESLDALAGRAHGKALEVALDADANVPNSVHGDPHRLRQIITNLVANAIKFTDQGEVVMKVAAESITDTDVVLRFTVADTGIGISGARLESIFQPFEQADTSTTRKYGGTGLGLAICKRLADLMGGNIWVKSALGRGSEFHFTASFSLGKQPMGVAAEELVSQLNRLRVMIVDDNQTNRRILHKMLSNWRMIPSLFESATAGLKDLIAANESNTPFDLVISDVNMPGVDGFEFVRAINKEFGFKAIPIILLTSSTRIGDNEQCKTLGVKAHMLKPARQSRILDAIVACVGPKTNQTSQESKVPVAKLEEQPLEPLKILLAEDNEVNQKFAVRALNRRGHSVTVVGNGEEAVRMWANDCFDVVLMDVQMPGVDGIEATAIIRNNEKESEYHTPIIALTAHAMKGDRKKCIDAGMDGYISKPIRSKVMFEEIARVMKGTLESQTQVNRDK